MVAEKSDESDGLFGGVAVIAPQPVAFDILEPGLEFPQRA